MRDSLKNRKGSITIIAIYIFIIMISSTTMLLYFSTLQSALSRNQITKLQSRYTNENDLNNLIYNEEIKDKYIKDKIFKRYRTDFIEGHKYSIDLETSDKLKETIKKASFEINNIDNREIIYFSIASNYGGIVSNILASGPFINNIFELNKSFLSEDSLLTEDKEMLLDFVSNLEEKNWDYDPKIISKAKKINTNNNLSIELISKERKNLLSQKKIIKNIGELNESYEFFKSDSMIIHLKRNDIENKKLTIGNEESENLITMAGVLYLEGDLIINENFEFEGLIIMNRGNIIIREGNTLTIKGMLLSKESEIDMNSIDLIYSQDLIWKSASFLPGFLDINIEVIKKL